MTSFLDFTSSLGLWLCTYAVHSTLLLALALVVVRAIRVRQHREWIWRVALLGGVLTASLQHAGFGPIGFESPRLELPAPVVALTQEEAPSRIELSLNGAASTSGRIAPTTVASRETSASNLRWPALLGALWMIGATALLVRLFVTRRRMLASLPRRPIRDPQVMNEVRALLANTRFGRRVRVSESPALSSPVAIGTREICVPSSGWRGLDPAHRSSLLAHEIAHLVRRDPAWLILTHAIERAFFVQPLNRVARRELGDEAEYLCDDWAAERTGEPEKLAGCLAEVASWVAERETPAFAPVLAPGMAHGPSSLVKRVERLLADREAPPSRAAKLAVAGGCALVVAVLGCAGPGVDIADDTVITAQIEESVDPFAIVRVSREGIAETYRAGDRLGTADLNTEPGIDELTDTLSIVASRMPHSDKPHSFPSGRLQIQIESGGLFRNVQKIMERCGTYNVQIWNLEVVGIDQDDEVYAIPLPHDLGVHADVMTPIEAVELEEPVHETPLPTEVGVHLKDRGPAKIEILVKTKTISGRRSVSYRIVGTRWIVDETGDVREYDSERTFEPFQTTNHEDVRGALLDLAARETKQRVTIDARAGTVYQDVSFLIGAVRDAGFKHIVFVGSYE